MHRITKFDLTQSYNGYVDPRVIEIMKELVEQYNLLQLEMKNTDPDNDHEVRRIANLLTQKYLEILYTNPAGFELTARMTTNYRCLLNIYVQRHDHRLPEWREFCAELLKLPMFPELVEAYTGEIVKI
jgi:hypothetical protein